MHLGEFLNIVCPKYSANDDHDNNKSLIEYHTLYKVSHSYLLSYCVQNIFISRRIKVSKNEYNSCQIQNTVETKQILRCDKPFDSVKYTLYISSYSPVPDAIEFMPGNSYYFICKCVELNSFFKLISFISLSLSLYLLATSNSTFNGMNNTSGGTCSTNNMKITVRVLDPSMDQEREKPITKSSLAAISSLTSQQQQISGSESVHTNRNLITSNLIYKFFTTTIKPLKMRLNSLTKKYKTVFKAAPHATTSIIETKASRLTNVLQQQQQQDSDLIIIQPDVEYSELLSLLQQQQKYNQRGSTVSSLFNAYFHPSPSTSTRNILNLFLLSVLLIVNIIVIK